MTYGNRDVGAFGEELEKEFGDLIGVRKLIVLLVIALLTCLAQVVLNQAGSL